MATTPLAAPATLFCGVADNHRLISWLGPLHATTPKDVGLSPDELERLESALLVRYRQVVLLHWPTAVPQPSQSTPSGADDPALKASPVYTLWATQLRAGRNDGLLMQLMRQLGELSHGRLQIQASCVARRQPIQGWRLGQGLLSRHAPNAFGHHSVTPTQQWRLVWQSASLEQILAQSDTRPHRVSIGARWLAYVQQAHFTENAVSPTLALLIHLPTPTATNGFNPRGIALNVNAPPALGLHTAWCTDGTKGATLNSVQIRRQSPAHLSFVAT